MAQTDAQVKATKKYLSKLDNITFRLPKGEKERIQAHAQTQNESMNAFLTRAVEETIERDSGKWI